LNRDMCKFESSQKDESRWQSTDSSKAYRNTSAFTCRYIKLILCNSENGYIAWCNKNIQNGFLRFILKKKKKNLFYFKTPQNPD